MKHKQIENISTLREETLKGKKLKLKLQNCCARFLILVKMSSNIKNQTVVALLHQNKGKRFNAVFSSDQCGTQNSRKTFTFLRWTILIRPIKNGSVN